MSVTLTEQAVAERRKTETRRLGWLTLKPGDHLQLCRKVMGRKRADGTVEPLVRVAMVEVTDVRRERLDAITDEAVEREGFEPGDLTAWDDRPPHTVGPSGCFVRFFTASMRCEPTTEVTVITWRYLD